jgi:hypothetical protein
MKELRNEKGQALIEFVLFLPLMLMLYATILSIGNSINGAINQQKVTRSYFYFRVQNNSYVPKPFAGGRPANEAWQVFGMYSFGWRDKVVDGAVPTATCYKLKLPLSPDTQDNCDDGYEEKTTQFIRVGTVYGICGATFQNQSGMIMHSPVNAPYELVDRSACTIQ